MLPGEKNMKSRRIVGWIKQRLAYMMEASLFLRRQSEGVQIYLHIQTPAGTLTVIYSGGVQP